MKVLSSRKELYNTENRRKWINVYLVSAYALDPVWTMLFHLIAQKLYKVRWASVLTVGATEASLKCEMKKQAQVHKVSNVVNRRIKPGSIRQQNPSSSC